MSSLKLQDLNSELVVEKENEQQQQQQKQQQQQSQLKQQQNENNQQSSPSTSEFNREDSWIAVKPIEVGSNEPLVNIVSLSVDFDKVLFCFYLFL